MPRNPLRDKAYEIWRASGGKKKLKDIAKEIGIPASRLYKWKCEDKWKLRRKSSSKNYGKFSSDDSNNKKPHGNTIALLRNNNAFKTGEYSTIWLDTLDEVESELFLEVNPDTFAALDEEIKLLTIRERRMMKLLNELKLQEEDIKTLDIYGYKPQKVVMNYIDSETGIHQSIETVQYEKFLKRTEVDRQSITDKILDIENALTRVQEKKVTAIARKEQILNSSKLTDIKERKLKLEEF